MKKIMILLAIVALSYFFVDLWMQAHECLIIYTGNPDTSWSSETKHGTLTVRNMYGFNVSCIE